MKVVGILGTPHTSGNTVILLDAVLEGAEAAGAEVEKLPLAGLDLKYCIACGRCYATGKCIYDDDVIGLQSKMMEADGIVLGAPNWMLSVPAQIKTMMDRCSLHVHTFLFSGKYGAAVSTAGGSGEEEIAEYMNEWLRVCGAQTVGIAAAKAIGIGALIDQDAAVAKAEDLGRDLVAAIKDKREYPDQVADHNEFAKLMKALVTRMAEHAPYQYEYWEKMGWL